LNVARRGYGGVVPWVARALLLALKTKRGRELLLAGATGAVELARSDRARAAYARAWEAAADPQRRQRAAELARRAAARVKR
jgi:phosphoenolpyruvate-protein kinase (PTS system EI component)